MTINKISSNIRIQAYSSNINIAPTVQTQYVRTGQNISRTITVGPATDGQQDTVVYSVVGGYFTEDDIFTEDETVSNYILPTDNTNIVFLSPDVGNYIVKVTATDIHGGVGVGYIYVEVVEFNSLPITGTARHTTEYFPRSSYVNTNAVTNNVVGFNGSSSIPFVFPFKFKEIEYYIPNSNTYVFEFSYAENSNGVFHPIYFESAELGTGIGITIDATNNTLSINEDSNTLASTPVVPNTAYSCTITMDFLTQLITVSITDGETTNITATGTSEYPSALFYVYAQDSNDVGTRGQVTYSFYRQDSVVYPEVNCIGDVLDFVTSEGNAYHTQNLSIVPLTWSSKELKNFVNTHSGVLPSLDSLTDEDIGSVVVVDGVVEGGQKSYGLKKFEASSSTGSAVVMPTYNPLLNLEKIASTDSRITMHTSTVGRFNWSGDGGQVWSPVISPLKNTAYFEIEFHSVQFNTDVDEYVSIFGATEDFSAGWEIRVSGTVPSLKAVDTYNEVVLSGSISISEGSVVGVALDLTSGRATIYDGTNTIYAPVFSFTDGAVVTTVNEIYPYIMLIGSARVGLTLNGGQQKFKLTPPITDWIPACMFGVHKAEQIEFNNTTFSNLLANKKTLPELMSVIDANLDTFDSSGFANNLAPSDSTLQKVLDKVDAGFDSGSGVSVVNYETTTAQDILTIMSDQCGFIQNISATGESFDGLFGYYSVRFTGGTSGTSRANHRMVEFWSASGIYAFNRYVFGSWRGWAILDANNTGGSVIVPDNPTDQLFRLQSSSNSVSFANFPGSPFNKVFTNTELARSHTTFKIDYSLGSFATINSGDNIGKILLTCRSGTGSSLSVSVFNNRYTITRLSDGVSVSQYNTGDGGNYPIALNLTASGLIPTTSQGISSMSGFVEIYFSEPSTNTSRWLSGGRYEFMTTSGTESYRIVGTLTPSAASISQSTNATIGGYYFIGSGNISKYSIVCTGSGKEIA